MVESFRDWLSGLGRREIVLLAVAGLVAAGAGGLWFMRSRPPPVEVRADGPEVGPSPTTATAFVHVAGWVRRPGVYELQEGSRVIDAIGMAGGPKAGADLTGLNLAALVQDAQQVIVPRRVRAQAPTVPADQAPGGPSASEPGAGLVNVNLADAAELETLPGIGPVLAQRIIDHRESNGPFTSVDQLEDVSGIGPVTMEGLRELVTV